MAISNLASGFRPGVCTSTTRPTNPFNGQVIYETDSKQTLVWQGSAWVMLTDADTPPGLQLVKTQTVGSGVASVTVTDAFSSEWDNYIISGNGIEFNTANDSISLQMRTGGTTATTNYYFVLGYWTYAGAANLAASNNGSSWNNIARALGAAQKTSFSINVNGPFLTQRTTVGSFVSGTDLTGSASGYHNSATSYTDFVLAVSGTMTGGTIRVYGYRN